MPYLGQRSISPQSGQPHMRSGRPRGVKPVTYATGFSAIGHIVASCDTDYRRAHQAHADRSSRDFHQLECIVVERDGLPQRVKVPA
eukprot:2878750-Prymnesium_polylepis.1